MASDPRLNAVLTAVLNYWVDVQVAAKGHGVPADVLAGLVAQESGGDMWAVRAEPLYRWLVGDDPGEVLVKPPISTKATEFYCQRISWGLCQIMGATARCMGFRGWFTELCEPAVGLNYGAKFLAWCLKRQRGNVFDALQRYNGGGVRNSQTRDYARSVLGWAGEFEG